MRATYIATNSALHIINRLTIKFEETGLKASKSRFDDLTDLKSDGLMKSFPIELEESGFKLSMTILA